MEVAIQNAFKIKEEPIQDQNLIDEVKQVCPVTGDRFETIYRDIILNNSLSEWANVNLWDVLNPQWIEEKAFNKYHIWSTRLKATEFVRNTFILLPITVTWLGLSIATSQFRALPAGGEGSFLYLWESGALGWLTFSTVGWIDGGLLLLITIATAFIHWNKEFQQTNAVERAAALRRKVEAALWEMERLLAAERYAQNISQSDLQANNAIELVKRELAHIDTFMASKNKDVEVQEHLVSSVKELKRSIAELNSVSAQSTSQVSVMLQESAGQVNKMYERVNGSIESLASRLNTIISSQQDFMISLDPLERYLETVGSINNSLSNAVAELKKDTSVNIEDRKALLKAVTQVDEAVTQLSSGNQNLSAALTKMSTSYAELAGELQRVASQTVKSQSNKDSSLALWVLVAVNVISIVFMALQFFLR